MVEGWGFFLSAFGLIVVGTIVFGHRHLRRKLRIAGYARGRRLTRPRRKLAPKTSESSLRFGNHWLPIRSTPGHFLVAGITGSGKSHVQRLLLEQFLSGMERESDSRMLIFDAKGDTMAYLNRIGLKVPVYSLNPLESRAENPSSVAWDIAKDITSPLRANNLSKSMITGEAAGANGYFVKAARAVVAACIKSFIQHAGTDWNFSDLIHVTTDSEKLRKLLSRDELGQAVLKNYLAENNTGYGVATTVAADMELYSPIAGLWQRAERKLSIRQWLEESSVLLLGENETASATLDVINAQMFTVFVEEVLIQTNSSTRRTGLWIDEAQEARCILQTGKLQSFANKARSRGGFMVLAFQDVEGFRIAAGDTKAADSIIAQTGFKVLLRQESYESAEWASKLVGQFETIQVFHSESQRWGRRDTGAEQRVLGDTVIPSEFYEIPETSPAHGLTGYFLSSRLGASKMTIPSSDVERVAVTDAEELQHAIISRSEAEQWLRKWTLGDKQRLGLVEQRERAMWMDEGTQQIKKLRLRASAEKTLAALRVPLAQEPLDKEY